MTTKSTHRTPPGVLVVGATGKAGRRVVARLRATPHERVSSSMSRAGCHFSTCPMSSGTPQAVLQGDLGHMDLR